jgi:hypothetical protein
MRNLYRILQTGILAVALIGGAGTLSVAQASAQAASPARHVDAKSSPQVPQFPQIHRHYR